MVEALPIPHLVDPLTIVSSRDLAKSSSPQSFSTPPLSPIKSQDEEKEKEINVYSKDPK